jgi:ketosteroid isomerase-like protein
MATVREQFRDFVDLLSKGKTVQAIEKYYGEDVCVFENRELARAGRDKCVAHERAALGGVAGPPAFKVHRTALDEATGTAFIEYTVRFADREGRPWRLDEVAVQTWEGGKISRERFYYEGVVDEGDEAGDEASQKA